MHWLWSVIIKLRKLISRWFTQEWYISLAHRWAVVTPVTLIWLISYYTISRWHTYAKKFTCPNTQSAIMGYLQTYSVAQGSHMCLVIYWDIILCGRSGLWPFWFLAFRFGLLPFRFVAFRFVAIPVFRRFGLSPFRLWPSRFVAVMTCYRYGDVF